MPTISAFYGILIQMFWSDHAPPHFHALDAEHEAVVDIRTPEIIEGGLPRRAMALMLEWRKSIAPNSWRIGSYAIATLSSNKIQPLP